MTEKAGAAAPKSQIKRAARHLATAAVKLWAGADGAANLRKALTLLEAGALRSEPARPDAEVEAQRLRVARALAGGDGEAPVCLFVAYAPDGRLWPHTLDYCRCLKAAGCRLVLIAITDRADLRVLDPGPEVADAVLARENFGFDFAAWAAVLKLWPGLWEAPALWFANDSVYHSPALLPGLMARIAASPADVVALTGSSLFAPHFQSYFFVLRRAALAAPAARDFFAAIRALADKNTLIRNYEVGMRGALEAGGLKVETLLSGVGAQDAENVSLSAWRELLDAGLPFVKVQLLRENPYRADLAGWRADLARRGFRIEDVELHLGSYPLPSAALLAP